MKLLLATVLVIPLFTETRSGHQQYNALETHIWALEEAYVAAFRDAKHDPILGLLHDRFLGWPDSQEQPTNKTQAATYLKKNHAEPSAIGSKIDRAGIQITQNVAITHYVIRMTAQTDDGTKVTRSIRITHTWIKEGKDWRILGGMSNAQ